MAALLPSRAGKECDQGWGKGCGLGKASVWLGCEEGGVRGGGMDKKDLHMYNSIRCDTHY